MVDPSSGEPARETVRYEALVFEVELLESGELSLGSARLLIDRGWGLKVSAGNGCNALLALSSSARRGRLAGSDPPGLPQAGPTPPTR